MKYQIDQSGKIEQTQRHTVISCTNDVSMSALLKKRDKRRLQKIFKEAGIPRLFSYLTFAALLAILLKVASPKYKVIVDREYLGHEDLIIQYLKNYLNQLKVRSIHVEFGHVGKLSKAHQIAYLVAIGKQKATKVVTMLEVVELLFGTKKIGR